MTHRTSRWATAQEIAAAEQAFPRDVSDQENITKIMVETGLSRETASLALAIMRGDSEGDEILVDDRL